MNQRLSQQKSISLLVKEDALIQPLRIDSFLQSNIEGYSRSFFQKIIVQGFVQVNHLTIYKPSLCLKKEDAVLIQFPIQEEKRDRIVVWDQDEINVLFENEFFMVINKPAGISVHPPHELHQEQTVLDWLHKYYLTSKSFCSENNRPGIVHRLDKDTSGILLIARNQQSQIELSQLFKDRKIEKIYHALVTKAPTDDVGIINKKIIRHPQERIKMVCTHSYTAGREAITAYTVIKKYESGALLQLQPKTGRTHQIRVHCASIGSPLIGDFLYGTKSPIIARHALHASKISFNFKDTLYSFHSELPSDFKTAENSLIKNSKEGHRV